MHVRSVFNTSCRITLEVSYRDKKCRLPEMTEGNDRVTMFAIGKVTTER